MALRGHTCHLQDQENEHSKRASSLKKSRSPPISAPLKKTKKNKIKEDEGRLIEPVDKMDALSGKEVQRMMSNIYKYGLPHEGCIIDQMARVFEEDKEEEARKLKMEVAWIKYRRSRKPDPFFYMEGWAEYNKKKRLEEDRLVKEYEEDEKRKAKEAALEAKKANAIAMKKQKKADQLLKHFEQLRKKEGEKQLKKAKLPEAKNDSVVVKPKSKNQLIKTIVNTDVNASGTTHTEKSKPEKNKNKGTKRSISSTEDAAPKKVVKKVKFADEENLSSQTPSTSRRIRQQGVKTCSQCGETNTPAWGRDGKGGHLCNACRVYANNMKRARPDSCFNRNN